MKTYTTKGDVRGCCQHDHRTIAAAAACQAKDQRACGQHGGYGSLATINEYVQPLADAAMARIKHAEADIDHWRVKATAYGGIVHGCSPPLAAAGHPVDASTADGAVGGIRRAVEALVAERDSLRAQLEEAHQTILNERGDGEPPSPGWEWNGRNWLWADVPDIHTEDDTWDVWTVSRGETGWVIGLNDDPLLPEDEDEQPTAREGMREADRIRNLPPETEQ